jgi:choloylglycine hydrolase
MSIYKGLRILALASLFVCSIYSVIFPCTTFVLRYKGHLYFGRNLDWISGTGLIMTNQRNLEKTALVDQSENPVKWVSKYGSLTFNQVGKELPFGGINEAGLVVEHMTLDKAIYPAKDQRNSIQACQWIQYQLDNCASISEVLESDKILRIVDATSKFHFLICDKSGNTAVIEFLDGRMVTHTGKNLEVEALANSTFDESIQCLKDYNKTHDQSQISVNGSLLNFTKAANMISHIDSIRNNSFVDYAFDILKAVSQGLFTKWSIVYDITEMKVYIKVFETPVIIGPNKIFRKTPGESKTKVIDLKDFKFDCSIPGKALDLELDKEGNVDQDFVNYTTELNKEFIVKAFTFYRDWNEGKGGLKEEEMDYLARYPESFSCK